MTKKSSEINLDISKTEKYLSMALDEVITLRSTRQLAESTRSAPWLLETEIAGEIKQFVLRIDADIELREIQVMRAMADIPEIPTPDINGWDADGETFGTPCFFYDYIDGESLLSPMLAGADWAVDLYLNTVLCLNQITRDQLAALGCEFGPALTAMEELQQAHAYFVTNLSKLTENVYQKLIDTQPVFPEARFSNGDLWLDNLLVKDEELVGVIDFEHAGFSDPIYEFLLPFFNEPRLRGRGIEAAYCRRLGMDPAILHWYHGLEYYDTLHYVAKSGEAFNQYSEEKLTEELHKWYLVGD